MLIKTISEEERQFKFLDIFGNTDNIDHYCIVTINVKKLEYEGNKTYYNISYKYALSNNSEEAKRSHPFFYHKIAENELDGTIVLYNSLTEKLVQYLLMDESELSKKIGTDWWISYKIQVMLSINMFWD